VPTLPVSHVEDALKLQADGKIHLFELSPLSGGTIYFKSDNEVTWQGHTYEAIPCALTGEEFKTEGTPTPKFTIGQEDVDLLQFKGLVNDGHLDGATLVRKIVLLDDIINNRNVKQTAYFRVKRIDEYSRTKIAVTLASFSAALSQTLPFRQYVPPAYPWVDI
jgi:phage-related protein